MSRISYFQDLLSSLFERRASGAASPDARDILDLCNALLADTGEVTGLQTGSALLGKYAQADQRRKLAFFQSLASDFDIDTEALAQRTSDYANERSANNLTSLLEVAEPRRQELLRRLNGVPGGTEKLVRMREDLLEILNEDASLSRVDVDFEHLSVVLVQPRVPGAAAVSTGRRRRPHSGENHHATRRCTRSTAGTICAGASQPRGPALLCAIFHPGPSRLSR